MEARENKGIHAGINQLHGLFVKTVPHIHCEYLGCLNGQRTVQVYLEIPVFRKKVLLLDISDKIEHFLGSSYRK